MEYYEYECLPSTNDTVRQAAYTGAPQFFTVAARTQNAGRGRLSRSFLSPAGGTYFSTVLRPTIDRSHYSLLTPFAAVAVRRAVYSLTGVNIGIKWVNDLLLDGKKFGGILSESGSDSHSRAFVIIGIGLNTGSDPLPEEISGFASRLPFANSRILISRIVDELSSYEKEILSGDFLSEYRSNCAFLGQEVNVIRNGIPERAMALNITDSGFLLVRWPNGTEEALCGDEISLRPGTTDEKPT